jgi:hypothetical protein
MLEYKKTDPEETTTKTDTLFVLHWLHNSYSNLTKRRTIVASHQSSIFLMLELSGGINV